ncbi:MAG: hypothetical protein Q7V01_06790, partial [Vicinamibacterales bacterium]|nr:hypothetical protein [Vicinamibacterales bacterium]
MTYGDRDGVKSRGLGAARCAVAVSTVVATFFLGSTLVPLDTAAEPQRSPASVDASQLGEAADARKVRVAKAREVVDRYRTAAGGPLLAALRSLVAEGVGWRRAPVAHEAGFTFRFAHPAAFQTIQLVPPSHVLGPQVFTVNGVAAWQRGEVARADSTTLDSEERVAPARRRVMQFALGIVPSLALDAGLVQFAVQGPRTEAPTDEIDLDVSDTSGSFGTLSFSRESHLPVRLTVRVRSRLAGDLSFV